MIADARPYNALWRLGLGIVTVLVVTFVWLAAMFWLASTAIDMPFTVGMTYILDTALPSPAKQRFR